jgi:hypothetical protein
MNKEILFLIEFLSAFTGACILGYWGGKKGIPLWVCLVIYFLFSITLILK